MFSHYLVLLESLVFVQCFAAWGDKYLSKRQLAERGIKGYALLDHGGWWADVFIISPLVAWIASSHRLPYWSSSGEAALLVIFLAVWCLGSLYTEVGLKTPEAYTHDGRTTVAGYLHGLYAVICIWNVILSCFADVQPKVTRGEALATAIALTPWAYLGVAKFNKELWKFGRSERLQTATAITIIWIVTFVRLGASN